MEHMEKEKDIEKARAKFRVYDQLCQDVHRDEDNAEDILTKYNNSAPPSKDSTPQHTAHHSMDTSSLAHILQNSPSVSRLPMPEPPIFTGDPLQYIQWKINFKSLIESKGITAAERMHYLKRYVGGEAQKAVEGFFYNNSEGSYTAAWNLLEERYGHTFKVQKAFRDKLFKWQKIGPKDSAGLQEFADFLRACKDAIPHVPGLKILNDCAENQRLLMKLPD
ncbi:uncharacterized protein [Ptychodera flava]|uniref:uncharacterized protein n=1 Tax=Ptychodera flava TaxID=63121 RepID=UPI00396A3FAF